MKIGKYNLKIIAKKRRTNEKDLEISLKLEQLELLPFCEYVYSNSIYDIKYLGKTQKGNRKFKLWIKDDLFRINLNTTTYKDE